MLGLYLLFNLPRHDLVHVHLAGLQTEVVAPLARLYRKPMYVKIAAGGSSGDVQRYSSLPLLPAHSGLRRATRIQAISEQIASDLRAARLDEKRIVRIPNGIELSRFHRPEESTRQEIRAALGFPRDVTIVLFVGRFDRQKGLFDLIAAWKDLHREGRTLLVLVGANNWSAERPDLFRAEGVSIHEWSPHIQRYYQAADIFVLPSYSEGMSNALLEAMASGLAPVATRVGAAAEMIVDGESGLLIEPGDRRALVEALSSVIDQPDVRHRLGATAAEVVHPYSISCVVDRIEGQYNELLGRGLQMRVPVQRESTPG